jgi:hypothetical protein
MDTLIHDDDETTIAAEYIQQTDFMLGLASGMHGYDT